MDDPGAFSPKKRKPAEQGAAPMAHKMIEKKRRDRMRESMEKLKTLVPAAGNCQDSKNVVKVDILTMTIDYLRELQKSGQNDQPAAAGVATGGSQGPPPTATLSSHMSRGMEDCVQDIGHYLMEVERIPPRDPSLVALLSHLQFWTKGQELNNRGKPVTDDQVEPLHNTSLDSMASSSLEGTPSGPSVKPPAKRITYGRPSDLLQAAAALRSPTEPRFFSPTTHEYSSGLDLISSVAQQSSLVNTAEKGESQGSNIGKERGQHVELLVFNPQATQATSQHTVPAQNRAVVVMPLSAAAKPSATTMTSTAFVEGGHGQTIAFSHAPPAVVNPIKAEEQPCPPLNMPLQGWSASIIPLTAPSVMATTAPIALHPSAPQPTNRSAANVVSPSNLPVRREWQ